MGIKKVCVSCQFVVKILIIASWKSLRGRMEMGSGAVQAPSWWLGLSSDVIKATLNTRNNLILSKRIAMAALGQRRHGLGKSSFGIGGLCITRFISPTVRAREAFATFKQRQVYQCTEFITRRSEIYCCSCNNALCLISCCSVKSHWGENLSERTQA